MLASTHIGALLCVVSLAGCIRVGFAPQQEEPLGPISCDRSAEVGTGQPNQVRAPAVRLDGLSVYAFSEANAAFVSRRPSVDAAFGSWASTAAPSGIIDVDFSADVVGDEVVLGASVASPHNIVACLGAISASMLCRAVDLLLDDGSTLGGENNAPSAASVSGGALIVLTHRERRSGAPQIFIGGTRGGDVLSWMVQPLAGARGHDATLSADGSLLLVARDSTRQLLLSRRRADGTFSPPRPLPIDSPPANIAHPSLHAPSSGQLEVFWLARIVPERIRSARCTY